MKKNRMFSFNLPHSQVKEKISDKNHVKYKKVNAKHKNFNQFDVISGEIIKMFHVYNKLKKKKKKTVRNR